MENSKKILVYGYGNPGRADDGLGIAFSESIESWVNKENIKNVTCESNYQLNIEDAEIISRFDIVIFADASLEEISSVSLTKVLPSDSRIEFSMHAVSSAFVLDLCNQIYNVSPQTWLIHIKGVDWDFREGFSAEAKKNLRKALNLIKPLIQNPDLLLEISEKELN
jgi:hydrogenase maturation protease